MAEDFVTLLSPLGASAAKRVHAGGVDSAQPALYHRGGEYPVASFGELAATLGRLVSRPEWFLVRGRIREGVNRESMLRRHREADATLAPAAHHWALFDLDHIRDEVPADIFAKDPGLFAADVRSMLPAVLQDAAMFWMATGSAGIKAGVRLRIGFWFARPVSDSELRTWVGTWGCKVDTALFTPSQPHYTAAPVFDGVQDPVPPGLRWGVLEGNEAVDLPPTFDSGRPGEAQEALAKACKGIKKLEEGERRNKINVSAFYLAKKYGEEDLPAQTIQDAFLRASAILGLPESELLFTLRNAIRDGRAKYEAEHAGWRDELGRDKDDNYRNTQANVTLFLEHHDAFRGRIGLNTRTYSPVWLRSPDWAHRERGAIVGAEDVTKIVEWLQQHAKLDAKEGWVRAGVYKASAALEYDPVQDYLVGLPAWDQTSRLSTFFIRHLGVEDTELNRAITILWFLQARRRAYATVEAPVKADYAIMLIGAQGLGKSGVFEHVTPGGLFRADLPDINSKDARQAVAGSWIVELAEFTQRKADQNAFKAFLTTSIDKFRPPYGKDEVQVPRRCVIAITTNDYEPLQDTTGNRRYWPMLCTKRASFLDVALERDQVWAEAGALLAAGVGPVLPPELEREITGRQEEHREENAFTDKLRAIAAAPLPYAPGFDSEPGQVGEGQALLWLRLWQVCAMVGVRTEQTKAVAMVKVALRDAGWIERRADDGRRAWYPPTPAPRAPEMVLRPN